MKLKLTLEERAKQITDITCALLSSGQFTREKTDGEDDHLFQILKEDRGKEWREYGEAQRKCSAAVVCAMDIADDINLESEFLHDILTDA